MELERRAETALPIVREAGGLALDFFQRRKELDIDRKGPQDFVSEADRAVEAFLLGRLAEALPDDGIVGEEGGRSESASGFTWVIDPIDGTTNFISGIPAWTVVLAGVSGGRTQIGIVRDPCHNETFMAIRGQGATRNGAPLRTPSAASLSDGTTGIGFSNRVGNAGAVNLARHILEEGGLFLRNASGALSIAYVADGRLLGYLEEHMNAWDCLAAQLIVEEAGGRVEEQDADAMIAAGGRVVVGAPGVFDDLVRIAGASFKP